MYNKYNITQTLSTGGLNQHSRRNHGSPPKTEKHGQKTSRTKNHCSKYFYVYPGRITVVAAPDV